MRIGTANIKNFPDMPPWKVEADGKFVSELTSVWGGQEIQVGEDAKFILSVLPDNWIAVGANTNNPIFINTKIWQVVDFNVIKWQHPKPLRKTNKHRSVVSVTLKHKHRPRLPKFAVVNTHNINGWRFSRLRRKYWNHQWEVAKGEVLRLHHKGMTVFFMGDMNRINCPFPVSNGEWLADGGIDYLGVVEHPKSISIGKPKVEKWNLHSDHPLKVVQVYLKR